MSEVLLSAKAIHKTYSNGPNNVDVLRGVDFELKEGELICIMGSSGSGKSTLLHILGTLDSASSGTVRYQGNRLDELDEEELAEFRAEHLGFVFQFHHLMAEFTALENVMMPCKVAGMAHKEAKQKAQKILSELNLSDRENHYPNELSGGEQQRVAIARALVREPKVLFADEPTGNLDSENSERIRKLFFDLHKEKNLTIVVVSHDLEFSSHFPNILKLKDGNWVQQPF